MVREKEKPDIPLPEPGDTMSPADHAQISRRFLEHFYIEKRKGNRLQASEKVWGAVSHALSAVGVARGLKHGNYFEKRELSRQIGAELAEAAASQEPVENRDARVDDFMLPYERAENLHRNFHQNGIKWPDIDGGQALAEKFVEQLDDFREKGSSQFTPRNEYDQQRWAMLNGHSAKKRAAAARYPLDKTITVKWSSGQSGDDDNGDASPVARPCPGSPPPEGGRAKPIPQSGQGTTPKVNLKPGKQLGQDDVIARPSATGRRPRQTRTSGGKSTEVNIRFG